MNSPMPALASVFYLRLADFSFKPVAEQARLRAQLEAAVGAALTTLAPEQRAVLDAPDGIVLVVLADPALALSLAQACLTAAGALPLCIGGNHGPVAPVDAGDGIDGLAGDGIRSAATAAVFARSGQMLLTAGFRAALAAHAPDRSAELRRAGVFSDASIRTHELFFSDPGQRRGRRVRLLAAAAVAVAALLGGGLSLRGHVPSLGVFAAPATVRFDVTPDAEVVVDGRVRGTTPPLRELALRPGPHRIELRRGDDPPHTVDIELAAGAHVDVRHSFAPPALLRFDITPGGEIFVDGRSRGGAPALEEIELPAGPHRIEVRHPDYPPHIVDVELQSGRPFTVRHAFARPAALVFDITPAGQLFVDGEPRGSVVDVRRLELAAGRHVVEVRHADYDPFRLDVTLKAGEEVVVRHHFERSRPAEFFRRLGKKLGL